MEHYCEKYNPWAVYYCFFFPTQFCSHVSNSKLGTENYYLHVGNCDGRLISSYPDPCIGDNCRDVRWT